MFPTIARGFRSLIYPPVCANCSALLSSPAGDFCPACVTALTSDPHLTCPRCTSSVGADARIENGCSRCRDERFAFTAAFRLGPYDGVLRDAILAAKYGGGESLAEALGRLWVVHQEEKFRETGATIVVPVPLHWWKRLRRGFNQAAYLSAAIADRLRIEHRPNWLRRVRATPAQVHLTPAQRRTNVRGAFRASRRAQLSGRTVLLMDDVLTTGSTASEAAAALLAGGAARVVVAILAHR